MKYQIFIWVNLINYFFFKYFSSAKNLERNDLSSSALVSQLGRLKCLSITRGRYHLSVSSVSWCLSCDESKTELNWNSKPEWLHMSSSYGLGLLISWKCQSSWTFYMVAQGSKRIRQHRTEAARAFMTVSEVTKYYLCTIGDVSYNLGEGI